LIYVAPHSIAGFSHDFRTLKGKYSVVADVLDSLGGLKPTFVNTFKLIFSPAFSVLTIMPTPIFKKFKLNVKEISRELLERIRQEKRGDFVT